MANTLERSKLRSELKALVSLLSRKSMELVIKDNIICTSKL